nr:MAG TPA: hypothetical protein [Caudoviricetes sp.]
MKIKMICYLYLTMLNIHTIFLNSNTQFSF